MEDCWGGTELWQIGRRMALVCVVAGLRLNCSEKVDLSILLWMEISIGKQV